MSEKTLNGNLTISTANYKEVSWVGTTKDGRAVTIKLNDAINLDNIDWALADKGEVIAALTYIACYSDIATNNTEPWSVKYTSNAVGSGEKHPENVLLGLGKFYIGSTCVGLCRGGGQFTVERVYRKQEADGDRGYVKGRIVIDESVAKLKMNILEVICDNLPSMYPGTSLA